MTRAEALFAWAVAHPALAGMLAGVAIAGYGLAFMAGRVVGREEERSRVTSARREQLRAAVPSRWVS